MKMLFATGFSANSSGGKEERLKTLIKTTTQWRSLGFDVHVLSDCPDIEVPGCKVIHSPHVIDNPDYRYHLPWRVVAYLKACVDSTHDFVAYAEDDIFMPDNTLRRFFATRDKIRRLGYRLGFYRVERDDLCLTDNSRWFDYMGSALRCDGELFWEPNNPHCASWIMSGKEFLEEYAPSPVSDWELSRGLCPWQMSESVNAGLIWHRPLVPNLCSVENGNVTHLWPVSGQDRPTTAETNWTAEELRKDAERRCAS